MNELLPFLCAFKVITKEPAKWKEQLRWHFIRLMLLPKIALLLSIASHYHTQNDNSIL